MKIGIVSTAYFKIHDFDAGFKKMKSHGYACADYQPLSNMNSELYSLSDGDFRDFLTRVGTSAKESGVEIWQMHGLWPTVGEDLTESDRQKTIEYFKKEIEAAHYLGCPYLVVHPFMPMGKTCEGDGEFTFQVNKQMLEALIPHAERFGVTVCIENMPFTALTISKVSELKRLVRLIDHPNIKICLDVGHANNLGDDIAEDVKLLSDDLAVLHVHDNSGRRDEHNLPYCGTVDWDAFLGALGEIGFNGSFNLETRISEKIPEPMLEQMRVSLVNIAEYMVNKIKK